MNLPLYSPTTPGFGVKRGYGRYELAVHFRLYPDFGRPHNANDCGRRTGATLDVDQGTRDKHEYDRKDCGPPSFAHVAVLS